MPVNRLIWEAQNCSSTSFLTKQVWGEGTCALCGRKCTFRKAWCSPSLPSPLTHAHHGVCMVCSLNIKQMSFSKRRLAVCVEAATPLQSQTWALVLGTITRIKCLGVTFSPLMYFWSCADIWHLSASHTRVWVSFLVLCSRELTRSVCSGSILCTSLHFSDVFIIQKLRIPISFSFFISKVWAGFYNRSHQQCGKSERQLFLDSSSRPKQYRRIHLEDRGPEGWAGTVHTLEHTSTQWVVPCNTSSSHPTPANLLPWPQVPSSLWSLPLALP